LALTQLANQVDALKTALQTALDKNEAIAAAAYAKALETLVKPDGVYTLIDEADTQIARVTAEADAQFARFGFTLIDTSAAAPTESGGYVLDVPEGGQTITLPDTEGLPEGFSMNFAVGTLPNGEIVTFDHNGGTIMGLSENMTVETPTSEFTFVLIQGDWKVFN